MISMIDPASVLELSDFNYRKPREGPCVYQISAWTHWDIGKPDLRKQAFRRDGVWSLACFPAQPATRRIEWCILEVHR